MRQFVPRNTAAADETKGIVRKIVLGPAADRTPDFLTFIGPDGRERQLHSGTEFEAAVAEGEIIETTWVRPSGAARWRRASGFQNFAASGNVDTQTGDQSPDYSALTQGQAGPDNERSAKQMTVFGVPFNLAEFEAYQRAAPRRTTVDKFDASRTPSSKPSATQSPTKAMEFPAAIERELIAFDVSFALCAFFFALPVVCLLAMAVELRAGENGWVSLAAFGWGQLRSAMWRIGPLDPGTIAGLFAPLCAFMVFVFAVYQARIMASAMGITGFGWRYRWTVLSTVVPPLNLVVPWMGFGEVYRALTFSNTHARPGDAWRRSTSISPFVLAASWLGSALILIAFHFVYDPGFASSTWLPGLLFLELFVRSAFMITPLSFLLEIRAAMQDLSQRHAVPASPAEEPAEKLAARR